jgi:hypothetical protein
MGRIECDRADLPATGHLAAERARTVTRLNSLVDEEVSAMIAAAGSVKDQISVDLAATDGAVAAIGEIEQVGRQGLAQLTEIVGLPRSTRPVGKSRDSLESRA